MSRTRDSARHLKCEQIESVFWLNLLAILRQAILRQATLLRR